LFAFRRAEMRKLLFRLLFIYPPFPYTQKHILRKGKYMQVVFPCVLFLVFLLFQPALGGTPPLQWQKTFGGSARDRGYCVQQTIDGGFIIAGDTESFGAGSSDVYLIKTDHNGNSQWQKTFGGSASEYGYSVQHTTDGGYIITGSTQSYGAGSNDVYLIKTDPNGNIQWQKTFGGIYSESARSVRQTSDGGYITASQIYNFTTHDVNTYLIKTDSNGTCQWQKAFGVIENDEFVFSVQQTTDGGYIMAGYTDPPDLELRADVYLLKTDPNGNTQWQKTFGGNDSDVGLSAQQTSDAGYIIAGYTGFYETGNYDVYLIKTDPNGNNRWQKTFGSSDDDIALSVQQTADGGYIIAGRSESYSCMLYNSDVYLIKTDPNGNSLWQKTVRTGEWDVGLSVHQTFDGGYVIAGYTCEAPFECYGDVYLIKLCSDGTLSADFNCNGPVYFDDLQILLSQWLLPPGIPSADIAPEPGDCIVNALDFAVLAQDWLKPVPGRAGNPDPPNNMWGINTTAKLSWTAGSNAVSHDVYFGTSIIKMSQGNQTNTIFDPGTMAYNTRYYWRIDEINHLGKTTGELWTFTTIMHPPP
jgi:hypothetical protein